MNISSHPKSFTRGIAIKNFDYDKSNDEVVIIHNKTVKQKVPFVITLHVCSIEINEKSFIQIEK